jgi:hypothetical protein
MVRERRPRSPVWFSPVAELGGPGQRGYIVYVVIKLVFTSF